VFTCFDKLYFFALLLLVTTLGHDTSSFFFHILFHSNNKLVDYIYLFPNTSFYCLSRYINVIANSCLDYNYMFPNFLLAWLTIEFETTWSIYLYGLRLLTLTNTWSNSNLFKVISNTIFLGNKYCILYGWYHLFLNLLTFSYN
jgi:hypothetical protein